MLIKLSGVDKDIIQVDEQNLEQVVVHHVLHQAAEVGRCAGDPEGHAGPLVQAEGCGKRRLFLVFRSHLDLMIA